MATTVALGCAIGFAIVSTSVQACARTATVDAKPHSGLSAPEVIPQCDGIRKSRPDLIRSLHCGTNADIWIDGISWTSWDSGRAVGRGIEHVNSCEPSCAAGNYGSHPVAINLGGVVQPGDVYSTITLVGSWPSDETDSLPTD